MIWLRKRCILGWVWRSKHEDFVMARRCRLHQDFWLKDSSCLPLWQALELLERQQSLLQVVSKVDLSLDTQIWVLSLVSTIPFLFWMTWPYSHIQLSQQSSEVFAHDVGVSENVLVFWIGNMINHQHVVSFLQISRQTHVSLWRSVKHIRCFLCMSLPSGCRMQWFKWTCSWLGLHHIAPQPTREIGGSEAFNYHLVI